MVNTPSACHIGECLVPLLAYLAARRRWVPHHGSGYELPRHLAAVHEALDEPRQGLETYVQWRRAVALALHFAQAGRPTLLLCHQGLVAAPLAALSMSTGVRYFSMIYGLVCRNALAEVAKAARHVATLPLWVEDADVEGAWWRRDFAGLRVIVMDRPIPPTMRQALEETAHLRHLAWVTPLAPSQA